MTTNAGKFFILDTNILLHDPLAFLNFDEHNVVIPMVVLEELDNIKDRNRDVSREARVAIRSLEEVLKEATPEEIVAGVPLNRVQGEHTANGTLAIFPDYQLEQTESVLSLAENDHRIIQAALEIQRERSPAGVVLVTKDINMRLKAKGAGMKYVDDYRTDQLIDDIRLLTKGFYKFEGDFWSQVGEVQTQQEGRDAYHTVSRELLPQVFANEYIIDSTNKFAARVEEYDSETVTLMDLSVERMMSYGAWGVHPNPELEIF
ncbi:PIN domain-containing protein [Idiomarina loihiensis]|uniref:PIN domain-containing protein n=1 Tax=Idiomarina sp. H2 TaxID=2183987 RepID=UPI000DA01547|nr:MULTISPECIES: PIN domain-containing protein [Idiomarina]PWW34135.1 PIN domain-containing protein [Idiomarina loihiensis]TDP44222.1 PIN domain-containing protein [Idiomarina loihiensis]TDS20596.1 PIN domain-containing protein [Idiomarina sp. H2]